MQCYRIVHRTFYNYSHSIALGSQVLLLRPLEGFNLRVKSFFLNIVPHASVRWHRDVEGNSVAIATFDQPITQHLSIETDVVIELHKDNPLDFLVADYAIHYPFYYEENDALMLSPYMTLLEDKAIDVLPRWMMRFWQVNETIQTYALLERLNRFIYTTMVYHVREEPGVQSALTTLKSGTGSCRDFALLFMEAAKCLGFAARFVSGYLYLHGPSAIPAATHAWAEVYLPGAGWTGFDPTTGVIVGPNHIPVAVSRLPDSVPPIAGLLTGTASSVMDVGVWVSVC